MLLEFNNYFILRNTMVIYCGNRAYWQWQRLTHPIVELLRLLVTITIHCDPWSGVRCLQRPCDRTKDYLIFTLYYALFNYTDCADTKHSDAACEWNSAALELVNVTASMCFPSLTGAASVSHTALVAYCFRKLGFYMREKKMEKYRFFRCFFGLMNNCYCQGFYAVIIYTLK